MFSCILQLLLLASWFLSVLARPAACGIPAVKVIPNGKAVYLLTNDNSNAVVALPIGKDGLLAPGSRTATGGSGANGIDGSTNQPAAPDALFSQSSLAIAGNVWSFNLTALSIREADVFLELVRRQCRFQYPYHVRHRPAGCHKPHNDRQTGRHAR